MTDISKSNSEEIKKTLRLAKLHYERELKALNDLNECKAINSIADLYHITSYELCYFLKHGEEETERHFNALFND